jgi:hypothetical protein
MVYVPYLRDELCVEICIRNLRFFGNVVMKIVLIVFNYRYAAV